MPSSRPVIHPSWADRNRPAAVSVLADRCTITREGAAGTLNRTTGANPGTARTTVATNQACRIELVKFRPDAVLAGDQRVTTRQYDVQVPVSVTGVQAEDRIEVLSVSGLADAELVGKFLRVLSVAHVSLAWTRVLRCQLDEG